MELSQKTEEKVAATVLILIIMEDTHGVIR